MKKILLLILILFMCFMKFDFFLYYGFLYLLLIGGSGCLAYLFNKKIDQTISLYFFIVFIYLYIFSIFNILKIGLYSLIVINIIGIIYYIFKVIKSKNYVFKEKILTPGFIVWTTLFLVFAISTRNTGFMVWDEYSFWSIASRNMYFSDSLYLNNQSTLFVYYPPNPTILQYFFCKVIGKYSQGIELFTCIMLGFSLICPIFKNFTFKDKKKIFSCVLCMLFSLAIFNESYFYFTIYTDTILGIYLFYIIYEYITSQKDKFWKLTLFLALFCLSLIKSTGIIFAILGIMIILTNEFIKNKNKKNFFKNKDIYLTFLFLILGYLSWKCFTIFSDFQLNYGYNSGTNNLNTITNLIKNLYHTVIGTNVPINETFSTFFVDFFEKGYYTNIPLGLTASSWISIFVLVYLYMYQKIVPTKEKKNIKEILILVFLSFLMYVIFIQLAYFLAFSEKEAVIHASMQRYIGSFFITLILLFVGIMFYYDKNKKSLIYIILPAILLFFTPMSAISNATITSGIYNYEIQNNLETAKQFSEFVLSKVKKDDKIYPVHQGQSDTYLLQFRYWMTPHMVPMVDRFSDEESYNYIKINDIDEWNEILIDYQYVAVLDIDDYFKQNYSDIFENNEIDEWSLYKIKKEDSKIKLYKVE